MNIMTIPPGSPAELSHADWLREEGLTLPVGIREYELSAKYNAAKGRIGMSAVRMAQSIWLQMIHDKNQPQASA